VTCCRTVEDWKKSGTEILKDMFKVVGVRFDILRAILLFVVPFPGKQIFEI
jgi:hypothetical protein